MKVPTKDTTKQPCDSSRLEIRLCGGKAKCSLNGRARKVGRCISIEYPPLYNTQEIEFHSNVGVGTINESVDIKPSVR